jgi:hypothetical protein
MSKGHRKELQIRFMTEKLAEHMYNIPAATWLQGFCQLNWDSDLELTLSIPWGSIQLRRRVSRLGQVGVVAIQTGWGNHAEPDVASFQMMGNYLVTSACLQFLTSCPLGKWISLQKSNSKFKCPQQIQWRKIISGQDVISVWKEQLCYCKICFSFRLLKFLTAQLRRSTARKHWASKGLIF